MNYSESRIERTARQHSVCKNTFLSPVTPRYSQPTKGGVRMDLSLFSGAEIKRLKRVAKSREMTVPQLIREALVKEGIL